MKKTAVNIARIIVASVFILSGFVKAVDPLGSLYKLTDYLEAMHLGGLLPDWGVLIIAVLQAGIEFCLGLFLLFAIQRRFTSRFILVIMIAMTPLTLWLALANPISDCGCFGDALVLNNWQTFWKNVVLLGLSVIVAKWPTEMFRFVSEPNQWIVTNYSALFILGISAWCLYDLPLFDFRPYHVGASIKEGMEIPEGAATPEYNTIFVMEKDGKRQTFTVENYPDSTWTFVEAKTELVKEGYVPPIHDFLLTNEEGDDVTDDLLLDTGYVFMLVSPHLEVADDSRFDLINELSEYAEEHGYPFYGVTASSQEGISRWRETTGAEYPFCQADEITLKTIIRSNPGLVLLKKGTVIRKWGHNNLPTIDDTMTSQPLENFEIGQMPEDSVPRKIASLLLWFVLPLALLTIADRTWMWTRWLRRKHKAEKKKEKQL